MEVSGSGSGDDGDSDDEENRHKEDFTPLEESRGKNTNGVEMKEEFVPFGKENGSRRGKRKRKWRKWKRKRRSLRSI